MRYFLEKYEAEKQLFDTAWKSGRKLDAKKHLLQSSKYLFMAAEKARASRKDELAERAGKLLELAKSIDTEKENSIRQKEDESGSTTEWRTTDIPQVSFDDVAGLVEAKKYLQERVIIPLKYPEKSLKFKIKPGGGLLLYGPPGTGKTMLAKAVANEIEAAFFSVKSSDIISKWVGDSERNIKSLFEAARKAEKAIIFIDEIEALLPRRGGNSTVMNRVVPEILSHLDGIEEKHPCLLIMGATNRPWDIDEAFLRPGRFDKQVYVGLPDAQARKAIIEYHLEGIPVEENINLDETAANTEGFSGADLMGICKAAISLPFMREVENGDEQSLNSDDLNNIISDNSPSVEKNSWQSFPGTVNRLRSKNNRRE